MSKSKYPTHVQPYLGKIKEMALTMTEEQIAKALGVSMAAWYQYKNHHQELTEALKKGRLDLCLELKSVLIQRAKGMQYQEKKQVYKNGELVSEEVYTRTCPPDIAAISLLMKNYDENWHNDDAATLELKRKQVEIMKQKADDAAYD